jgi:hypothetical protein
MQMMLAVWQEGQKSPAKSVSGAMRDFAAAAFRVTRLQ